MSPEPSRPDEGFVSWPSFEVVKVCPLEKEQSINFINSCVYDETEKQKLIKLIKSKTFYNKQQSFLSNPLLLSMMLITLSHNGDISGEMHQFYEECFDALYKRHDRFKPGSHTREMKCAVDEQTFKRIFSYFCYYTYVKQEFTFNRTQMLEVLSRAIRYNSKSEDASLYLEDLVDSVCLMIKDGPDYIFSHRSFQEYFAAYFISYVVPTKIDKVINSISMRYTDEVIRLVYEMNPDRIRDNYFIPIGNKYKKFMRAKPSIDSTFNFLSELNAIFIFACINNNKNKNDAFLNGHGGEGEFYNYIINVNRVCNILPTGTVISRGVGDNEQGKILLNESKAKLNEFLTAEFSQKVSFFIDRGEESLEINSSNESYNRMVEMVTLTRLFQDYVSFQKNAYVFLKEQGERSLNVDAELEDILS